MSGHLFRKCTCAFEQETKDQSLFTGTTACLERSCRHSVHCFGCRPGHRFCTLEIDLLAALHICRKISTTNLAWSLPLLPRTACPPPLHSQETCMYKMSLALFTNASATDISASKSTPLPYLELAAGRSDTDSTTDPSAIGGEELCAVVLTTSVSPATKLLAFSGFKVTTPSLEVVPANEH